jgi:hypothetical protein
LEGVRTLFCHVFLNLSDIFFIMIVSGCMCRYQRARPIIVDPALQISNKTEVVTTKEKRSLPSAFKIFVGIASSLFST